MEARRRRARAQVARCAAFALAALLACGSARAAEQITCAGDGDPPERQLFPSGLARGEARFVPNARFDVATVRAALCGRFKLKRLTLFWNAGWEFYSSDPNVPFWGAPLAGYVGAQPFRWLTIYAGLKKVAFAFAHDEPEQTLTVRRPDWAVNPQLTPDRRLGITLDVNFGSARLVAGIYAGAPRLDKLGDAAILGVARALIEPLGPVGNRLSTVDDDPVWRRRARFGLNLSFLYLYDWRAHAHPEQDPSGYAVGGDVPFKWGPVGFVGEVIYFAYDRTLPPLVTGNLQLALMLWRPWLELESRYQIDLNGVAFTINKQEALAGLTLYAWQSRAKIQLAYRHLFVPYNPQDIVLLTLQLAR